MMIEDMGDHQQQQYGEIQIREQIEYINSRISPIHDMISECKLNIDTIMHAKALKEMQYSYRVGIDAKEVIEGELNEKRLELCRCSLISWIELLIQVGDRSSY